MLKAKTKQKQNRTEQNNSPQETNQVNEEWRAEEKDFRVGELVRDGVKDQNTGGRGILQVHRLGNSYSTGDRKYKTKTAVQLHYHTVPRNGGPTAPCD